MLTDDTDPGPLGRFRMVILLLPTTEPRGEARGGVGFGAGSLDRAFCTRASSFCILAVRDRMWDRDADAGIPFAGPRAGGGLGAVGRAADAVRDVAVVADRVGGRDDDADEASLGLGVVLVSIDGNLDLLGFDVDGTGVLMGGTLVLGSGGGAEASDMGGDGGSLTGVLTEDTEEAASSGVVMSGELAVDMALASNMGLSGIEMSVSVADR